MSEKYLHSVLIIDDNGLIRAMLRGILRGEENADYAVVGEANGCESGLELALELRPDIVCLDVIMPQCSGLDVLKEIKTKLPQTVVMMVTSDSDSSTVKAAAETGASGYIIKPFNTGTVLNMINQAVAKSRELKAATAASSGSE